ncbi:MAG: TonB-dependent receptor plug domain-containing protein, partial [Colwellia sp.]
MLLKNIALPFSSSNIATSKKNKVFTAFSLCLSLSAFSYTSVASAQKISGQVINNQGKPLILATVKINGSDQEVRTDKQGFFSFKQLKPGNIELHTSAKNYAHNNHHISLNKNDISNVLIELSPSVMEVLDVYATPLHSSTIESALPVSVISGDDLKLKQAATLGETLKNEVGVHSSFYGSVASSPIIRGLDGPRVLITQNGLDAGDASRIGADHAVSTETSTATQIEILRGPATLFYGSGAIGGVVNVVDNRVPTSDDETAEWLLQYNDVANEKQASLSWQNGMQIAGKEFAVHLDGFWRDAGDYKLPNDFAADDNESHLASSESRASGLTFGSSYLFDQGFVG